MLESGITPIERYELLKKGVATNEVKLFMQKFDLGQKQMATLLLVSDKTLYAQFKRESLDENLSDRFLLIASVLMKVRKL
jgi:hypothetical protein